MQKPARESRKVAVLLMNYGGPEKAEDCRDYLRNIFMDPDLIPIPGLIRPLVASLVARRRAPTLAENYEAMGQYSPTLAETTAQAKALEAALGGGYRCFVGMRYWRPFIGDVCRDIVAQGFGKVVLLPVYPHDSRTTTGSSVNEARRHLEALGFGGSIAEIRRFWDAEGYLSALAEGVSAALSRAPGGARVLFSSHGLPLSVARKDLYPGQVAQTVRECARRLGVALDPIEVPGDPAPGSEKGAGGRWRGRLAWQSKVGPAKWLTPSVETVLEAWAAERVPHVVVVPVAFVNEHSETLYELDVLYGDEARKLGMGYTRVPTLGTAPDFIDALARLVGAAS